MGGERGGEGVCVVQTRQILPEMDIEQEISLGMDIFKQDKFQIKICLKAKCYTLGKCTLRLIIFSASADVNLYTPMSCNAALAGQMPSSLLSLPEDLSKSLSNTADPGKRFNKIQASLTLDK